MALEDKAIELIDKLAGAIERSAQPAAEIALQAVQLEGILYTSIGVVLVVVSIGFSLFLHNRVTKHDWYEDTYMAVGIFGGGGLLAGIITISCNVIAAVNPAAALALRVIHAAT